MQWFYDKYEKSTACFERVKSFFPSVEKESSTTLRVGAFFRSSFHCIEFYAVHGIELSFVSEIRSILRI